MQCNLHNSGLIALESMASEVEARIIGGYMTKEYATTMKNGIEGYVLPTIDRIYDVIPEGCDAEDQPYSSYYIESKYDSGVPLSNAEITYLRFYRLSRELAKYPVPYEAKEKTSFSSVVYGGNNA